jgi:hypothetical protein
MIRLSLAVFLAVFVLGCGPDGGEDPPPATVSATVADLGPGGDLAHPQVGLPPESRAIKRLTVAMLADSIPIVAGLDNKGTPQPIVWRLGQKDALGTDTKFGLFDRTLGRPDYVQVTHEPAEPSALYVKFMGDMARDVCARILESDNGKAPAERTLTPKAPMTGTVSDAELGANLRYLKLRFWGEYVPDGAEYDDQIADLATVFDAVIEGGEGTAAGWNAVCVTLLTSPAFHLY